jgi:tetratricopeptide (TPR) repeat protein
METASGSRRKAMWDWETSSVTQVPSPEQHRALLNDCWALARALPDSGVLNRARQPYRAIRIERKLDSVTNDPVGLLEYVRGMARRTSDGLDSLVEYDRLDLSVETLIIDESKIYAPLFSAADRAAANAKLAKQAGAVEDLARSRARQVRDNEAAREERIRAMRLKLPDDVDELRNLASEAIDSEQMIAIDTSILEQIPTDVVALNRLGRAYQDIGLTSQARHAFQRVLEIDPSNRIAIARLSKLGG